MEFTLQCNCGNSLTVPEGAAGTQGQCSCGRAIDIPSLTELRVLAGLPPQPPNPAVMIGVYTAEGSLPSRTTCAGCDAATSDVVTITAECEIASHGGTMDTGGSSMAVLAFLGLFFGMWIVVFRQIRESQEKPREHGDSRIVHCPVRICSVCRAELVRNPAWLTWAAVIQVVLGIGIAMMWSGWGAVLLASALITWWIELAAQKRQQAELKVLMSQEPIYEQLLSDFPKAKVLLNLD